MENAIAEYRAKAARTSPADWDALAASTEHELKAIEKERAQRQDAQTQSIQKSKTL